MRSARRTIGSAWAVSLVLWACRPVSSTPPVVPPPLLSLVSATTSHVPAWFGYYADGSSQSPVTAAVAGHVNLSWVGSSTLGDVTTLLANMAYAHSQGLKMALMVPADVFFNADLTLAADYARNWAGYADQVRPYLDDFAFIYPIDEPYAQGKGTGTSAAEMKRRLETVSSLIKTTFPSVPLAFTFTVVDFDTRKSAFADLANPLPANYDYFGFDCYGSWDRCGTGGGRPGHPIPWYVSQIKGKLSATQRIFLFADAFVRQARGRRANPARDTAEAALRLTWADQYYQLALSDSSIIGLFAFLYQDDYVEDSRRFLGVRHWPALQARYVEIGRHITGK